MFFWKVVAKDTYLARAESQVWSFITQPMPVPLAPSDLSANGAVVNKIDLIWKSNSNNESGFKIERKLGSGGVYALISTATGSQYTDSSIVSGNRYYYRVRAYNSSGESDYSNEISLVAAVPPNTPAVTCATPTNNTKPTWTWISGGGGNGTFRFKLDNSDLGSGATTTTYLSFTTTTSLTSGSHTLYVQENDSAGNWSLSGSYTIVIVTAAPTTPSVYAPSVSSEVTSLTPTLSVNAATDPDGDPVTYNYEVYSDIGLTTLVASATNQGAGWIVSPALTDNTTYYWRAQATDGFLNSSWMSTADFFVNTANDAPTEPTISSPSSNTHVSTLTPILIVTNATDIDKNDTITYDYEIATDGGFANIVASVTGIPQGIAGTTSLAVASALVEYTPYYWRSRAIDNHGALSNWVSTSFLINTANSAPSAPVLSIVLLGSEVSSLSPILAVNNAGDPEEDALHYVFEIDTVNTFSSAGKQTSGLIAEGAGTTSWAPSILTDNMTYFWRAKANDGLADGPWMASVSFFVNTANDAPTVPTLNNPANNGQVTVLSPTLSVNAATDIDNDLITYEYAVYSDSGLTSKITGTNGAGTSWTVSPALLDNTTYYWRARAIDVHGLAGGWMAASSFSVNNNGYNDPPTITVTSPANMIAITSSATYTITWIAADPDSDPIITLYFDTVGSGHSGTQIVTGLHKSDPTSNYAWSVSGLPDGVYHVYAKIDDGTTAEYAYAPGMLIKRVHSGDISGDGVVDVNDALTALRIVAGISSGNAAELAHADVAPIVNGVPQPDGKVDIGDVVVILRAAVGLINW